MRSQVRIATLSLASLALMTSVARAERKTTGFDPCDRVESACIAAGFNGGPGPKNLHEACIKPLAAGAAVPGVTVSRQTAAVCMRIEELQLMGTDETSPDACGSTIKACQAGGYHVSFRNRGNDLYADCMGPLLLGQQVSDVQVGSNLPGDCLREPEPAPVDLRVHGFSPCYRVQLACELAGEVGVPACTETIKAGKPFGKVKVDPAVGVACKKLTDLIQANLDDLGDTPCGKVVAACKSGGFFVGGSPQHKGMQFDCLTPILLGQIPSSVHLDAATAKACVESSVFRAPASGGR